MRASPLGELALGLAKIHILYHAARREIYGLWLLEELADHGYRISPGTLYPLLARMEKNGWLRQTSTARSAKGRRSLVLTPSGKRVLRVLRSHVVELYREVVLDEGPETGSVRIAPSVGSGRAAAVRRRSVRRGSRS